MRGIMQCRVFFFSVSVVFILVTTVKSNAAPFQNLDFEEANTNRLSTDPNSSLVFGSTADLVPGWQIESSLIATEGSLFPIQSRTNQLDSVWFRSAPQLLETTATLTESSDIFSSIPKVGTYSLLLGTCHCSGFESYLSLIQRGDVPASAALLTMDGVIGWTGGSTYPEVTINGISSERVSTLSGSPVWNASAFGGQNVELKFTINPGWSARVDGFRFMFRPAFSDITRNGDGTITIQWNGGGTLLASAAVNGPWQEVSGAASPYTLTPTGTMLFTRIRL